MRSNSPRDTFAWKRGETTAPAMLEPVMLRSISPRDTFAWKRGETTATAGQLMAFNGITAEALSKRGLELVK
jgi:phosphoketolase